MIHDDIRTYVGDTMRMALANVRDDLGADAVILHTRQVEHRSILGKKKTTVEVTASCNPSVAVESRTPSNGASERMEVARIKDRFRTSIKRLEADPLQVDGVERSQAIPAILRPKLSELPQPQMPFPLPTRLEIALRDRELGDALIRDCLETARLHDLCECEIDDPRLIDKLVETIAARLCPVPADQSIATGGVIALVGPTGVGKTTTIAKLALLASTETDRKVHLVDADIHRIGGIHSLQRYAEILGVRWSPVRQKAELREILKLRDENETVLIDTPGLSPVNQAEIDELVDELSVGANTWLVLAANTSDSSVRASLDAFHAFGYQRLILTKLDETPGTGAIATIAARAGVPVPYVAVGRSAAADLVPVDAGELARWALGAVPTQSRDEGKDVIVVDEGSVAPMTIGEIPGHWRSLRPRRLNAIHDATSISDSA